MPKEKKTAIFSTTFKFHITFYKFAFFFKVTYNNKTYKNPCSSLIVYFL